jgi:hypothetical protein
MVPIQSEVVGVAGRTSRPTPTIPINPSADIVSTVRRDIRDVPRVISAGGVNSVTRSEGCEARAQGPPSRRTAGAHIWHHRAEVPYSRDARLDRDGHNVTRVATQPSLTSRMGRLSRAGRH